MGNNYYVSFDILGIKPNGCGNAFRFEKDAECMIGDDFICKIVLSADISKATFYLNDSLEFTENKVKEIIDYLSLYLGNLMVVLLKNCLQYPSVLLKPTIRISVIHLPEINSIRLNDNCQIKDSVVLCSTFSDGNEKLKKWVQGVEISDYTRKKDKYDILFLLLQGENIVQKYMAMYAYLMSLVKEIYSKPNEGQKQVVKYVCENCARVGIELAESPCNRPGAKANEKEDQFTALRNKIGHPAQVNSCVNVTESAVNQLASIICCAIEDIPSGIA